LSWLAFDEYVKAEEGKVRALFDGKEIDAKSRSISVNGTFSLHGPDEVSGEFSGYDALHSTLRLVDGRDHYGVCIWTEGSISGVPVIKRQGLVTGIS